MMTRVFAMFAVLVLTVGCQTTGEILKKFSVDSVHEGFVSVGNKQIPLLPGEWQVLATETSSSSDFTPVLSIMLGSMEKKAGAFAITIHTNIDSSGGWGWALKSACLKKQLLHVRSIEAIEGTGEGCWFLNHLMLAYLKRGSFASKAFDSVKRNGVVLPKTSVYTGFRFSDTHEILEVRYFYNPEVEGFEPPHQLRWKNNDWHKDQIHLDLKRVAYVEKMKKWAEAFFSKVETGFRGKLVSPKIASK